MDMLPATESLTQTSCFKVDGTILHSQRFLSSHSQKVTLCFCRLQISQTQFHPTSFVSPFSHALNQKHPIKPKHTLPQPCNQRLSSTSNWSKLSKAPSYCSPLPAKSLVFLVQPHWPPRHWRKKSAVPRCSRYPGGSMTSWCPEARTRPYHIITWKKSSATK